MKEVVIKIPEELYNEYMIIQLGRGNGKGFISKLLKAIKDGIPLPENHGRLMILSEDKMKENLNVFDFSSQNWISEVGLSNATIAIIEATDKEG